MNELLLQLYVDLDAGDKVATAILLDLCEEHDLEFPGSCPWCRAPRIAHISCEHMCIHGRFLHDVMDALERGNDDGYWAAAYEGGER